MFKFTSRALCTLEKEMWTAIEWTALQTMWKAKDRNLRALNAPSFIFFLLLLALCIPIFKTRLRVCCVTVCFGCSFGYLGYWVFLYSITWTWQYSKQIWIRKDKCSPSSIEAKGVFFTTKSNVMRTKWINQQKWADSKRQTHSPRNMKGMFIKNLVPTRKRIGNRFIYRTKRNETKGSNNERSVCDGIRSL